MPGSQIKSNELPPYSDKTHSATVQKIVFIGGGSAIMQILHNMNGEYDRQNSGPRPYENKGIAIIAVQDAWHVDQRGEGFINQQHELIDHDGATVTQYNQDYADRGAFTVANAKILEETVARGAVHIARSDVRHIEQLSDGNFRISFDSGEPVITESVVLGTGLGRDTTLFDPYPARPGERTTLQTGRLQNMRLENQPKLRARGVVMTATEFSLALDRNPGQFAGKEIAVQGSLLPIDVVEKFSEKVPDGKVKKWLIRENINFLEGQQLQHAPKIGRDKNVVVYARKNVTIRPNEAPGKTGVIIDVEPENAAHPLETIEADYYVYGLGQDPELPGSTASLLDRALLSGLEPIYDINQAISDKPYRTVIGLKIPGKNPGQGIFAVGGAILSLIAAGKIQHTYLASQEQAIREWTAGRGAASLSTQTHNQLNNALASRLQSRELFEVLIRLLAQECRLPVSELTTTFQGSLTTEKFFDVFNNVINREQNGGKRAALQVLSNSVRHYLDARSYLEPGIDRPGTAAPSLSEAAEFIHSNQVASVMSASQLTAIRSALHSQYAMVPEHVRNGEINYSRDNHTNMRIAIVQRYESRANFVKWPGYEEAIASFIQEAIDLRSFKIIKGTGTQPDISAAEQFVTRATDDVMRLELLPLLNGQDNSSDRRFELAEKLDFFRIKNETQTALRRWFSKRPPSTTLPKNLENTLKSEVTEAFASIKQKPIHGVPDVVRQAYTARLEELANAGINGEIKKVALARYWLLTNGDAASAQDAKPYGRFSGTPLSEPWEAPDLERLTARINAAPVSTGDETHYKKQLIVQLQGDETSYYAAEDLFAKHPRESEWLQLRAGQQAENIAGIVWNKLSGAVQAGKAEKITEGPMRIVLTGHTSTADGETLFGGRTSAHVEQTIIGLLRRCAGVDKLQVDLLGCTLMGVTQPLETTIPGKITARLMEEATRLGIPRENILVSARKYPVRVNAKGKKEILTVEHGWITKEAARLADMVHKIILGWDPRTQKVVEIPLPLSELITTGKEIKNVIDAPSVQLPETERQSLSSLLSLAGERTGDALREQQAPQSTERTPIEILAQENAATLSLGATWEKVIAAIKSRTPAIAGNEWIPLLETRTGTDGSTEMTFAHQITGQRYSVTVSPEHAGVINDFSKKSQSLVENYQRGLSANIAGDAYHPTLNNLHTSGVYTLNAAFLLQTLIEMNADKDKYTHLTRAMKIQLYVQLTQNTTGLIGDAAHVAQIINAGLKTSFQLVTKTGMILGNALPVVGTLLDVANLGLTSWQLSHTIDPLQKAVLKGSVATAAIGATWGLLATIFQFSRIACLASMSTPMGYLMVPLMGLSQGAVALVQAYAANSLDFDRCVEHFDSILDSIAQPGFQVQDGMARIHEGAVVCDIDFTTGVLQYGQIRVTSNDSGWGSMHLGKFPHYFTRPNADWQEKDMLDVYTGLGLQKDQHFAVAQIQDIVLPGEVNRDIEVDYTHASFHRGVAAPALRRLHEYYQGRFVWLLYSGFTDWGFYLAGQIMHDTPVAVKLDGSARRIIMPNILDEATRQHLSYSLKGHGGRYQVMLPVAPVRLEIEASADAAGELWIVNIDAVSRSYTFAAERITQGSFKPALFQSMQITHDRIVIGGQTIIFKNQAPPAVLLNQSIGENATLVVSVYLASQRSEVMVLLESTLTQQTLEAVRSHFTQTDASVLAPGGWTGIESGLNVQDGIQRGILDLKSGDVLSAGFDGRYSRLWCLQQGKVSEFSLNASSLVVRRDDSAQLFVCGAFERQPWSGQFVISVEASRLRLQELQLDSLSEDPHIFDELVHQFTTDGTLAVASWFTTHVAGAEVAEKLKLSIQDKSTQRHFYFSYEHGYCALEQATWFRDENKYAYSRESSTLWICGQSVRLDVLHKDFMFLPQETKVLVAPGMRTRDLYFNERVLQGYRIAILMEEMELLNVHLEKMALQSISWQWDGADLLLLSPKQLRLKLMNVLSSTVHYRMNRITFHIGSERIVASEVFSRMPATVWLDNVAAKNAEMPDVRSARVR